MAKKTNKPRQPTNKPRQPGTPLDPIREAYAGQRAMGYSQRASFLKANPKASKMKLNSVDAMASMMEAEPDVQARRREIQAELIKNDDAICSKKEIAELLSDALRRAATEEALMSSAAGIADKLNKMFGYYEPERHDFNLGCLEQGEVDAKITALLNLKKL